MKQNLSDSEEICTFCRKTISSTGTEEWTDAYGTSFMIDKPDIKYALADTSLGEICICDECYKSQEFTGFLPADICEIHYQFGLGFLQASEDEQALKALNSALNYGSSTDLFLALTRAHSRLGHHAESKMFQQLASGKS